MTDQEYRTWIEENRTLTSEIIDQLFPRMAAAGNTVTGEQLRQTYGQSVGRIIGRLNSLVSQGYLVMIRDDGYRLTTLGNALLRNPYSLRRAPPKQGTWEACIHPMQKGGEGAAAGLTNDQPLHWHPISGAAIANLFLDLRDAEGIRVGFWDIQFLVYVTCRLYTSLTGRQLLAESFEAWKYGPVLTSLYDQFKKDKGNPIKERATDIDPRTGAVRIAQLDQTIPQLDSIIQEVWTLFKTTPYRERTAFLQRDLENMLRFATRTDADHDEAPEDQPEDVPEPAQSDLENDFHREEALVTQIEDTPLPLSL